LPVEHTIELRVRYAETDQMQVVYHANYLVWCEIGRTELMRKLGAPYARVEEQGIGLAVIDASMRFHAAAKYDDRIHVSTTVCSVKSRIVEFRYNIANADTGTRLASVATTLAAIKRDGRLVSLPQNLKELLENALA
jgi:acyl-CoA thioester hydrolase